MIQLLLRLLLLTCKLGDRPTLAAQHRQPTHALFTGAIVQRIRLRLECVDFLLHSFRGFATGATIKIGERQRELLDLAK